MPTNFITMPRSELYDRAWSRPVTEVAKEFGISDVTVATRCRALKIPLSAPVTVDLLRSASQTPAYRTKLSHTMSSLEGFVCVLGVPPRKTFPADKKEGAAPIGAAPPLSSLWN